MSAGPIDEDTARTIQSGRESLGAVLVTVQERLQKAFIAFAIGLLAGILAMRNVVWPTLRADLLDESADLVVLTPFDVILLQVKIGLIVGVLFAIPTVLYYSRHSMAERGIIEDVPVSRWKAVLVALVGLALFVGGAIYAYYLFFPIMFSFLADNATNAGFAPHYSIIAWTQFILVLGLSFGLAAQLPLAMTALSYSGVVPYETFRDKWKYAVVLIFAFGAVFSPPDPFTQIMWAAPLVALYGLSLYLAKVVVTAKRGSGDLRLGSVLRASWNRIAGAAVLAGGAAYAVFRLGAIAAVNDAVLPALPPAVRPAPLPSLAELLGLPPDAAPIVVGVVVAVVAAVLATLVVVYRGLEAAVERQAGPALTSHATLGTPEGLDVDELSAAGVYAAPPEAFRGLDEETALEYARAAMADDDPEKAEAILERFDEAQAAGEGEGSPAPGGEARDADDGGGDGGAGGAAADDGAAGVNAAISRTTSGVFDAFTEEETTEDDIGGYYHDIRFIVGSLRSRMFRIFAVFFAVLAGTFYALYSGGIGVIRRDFLARIPREVRPEEIEIVTLHPVEALVFEVKLSTLLALVAILPMLVYYAWPALNERGLVSGDRRVLAVWGGTVLAGIGVGSVVGYTFVAPNVISWLVWDALQADMVIAYRVNNFFWLVFLTTVGVGLLFDIPVTMVMFHYGGIVSFEQMLWAWRGVAVAAFVFGSVVTPDSLYTMLIIGIPIVLFYWIGLGLLWVLTLGGRRGGDAAEPAPPLAE